MKNTNYIKVALAVGMLLALLLSADILLLALHNDPFQSQPGLSPSYLIRFGAGLLAVSLLTFSAHRLLNRRNLASRREAEAALEEQRRFLRQVIDTNPNAIFVRNRDGRYVLANTKAAEQVGCSIEELIGTYAPSPKVIREQAEIFLEEDRRVMDTLEPIFHQELEVHYADGDIHWQQISKIPLVDPDGTSNQVLVIVADITRRQQAEAELEEQRRFLRQVIDAIPNAIFVRNRDGRYVLANAKAAVQVGLGAEELIGTYDAETNISPEQVELFLTEDQKVMDSLVPLIQPEMKVQFPDGKIRWIEASKIPLVDPDGTSNRILVVLVDISERKQAEESLQKSEAQFRAAVEDHPGFISRFTPDLTITYVNKAYSEFFGVSAEEIIGHNLLDVIAPYGAENLEGARQIIAGLTPQNPVFTHEHSVKNALGEQRWVRWTDRLLLDEHGEPLGFQASGLDITDRRQAEAKLEEQRRFLSQVINATPNAIFVRDRNGRYTLLNQNARETIGEAPGDVVGQSQHRPDFDQEEARRFLEEDRFVLESKQDLFIAEEEITLPSGEKRWVQTSKQPLIGPDNMADQVLIVLVDLTERKIAEEALLRSEAQYRAAVEDHPGFIYRYAPDLTITFVNRSFCDFFGLSPEDILGHNLLEIIAEISPDSLVRAKENITKLTLQNPVLTHEHSVLNTRGESRWVRWIDRLLLDENGEPLEYQTSGLDITDRRQAEEAIEEQRRFLRQIIDANPNMIFVRDYASRYVLMNKKAAELLGLTLNDPVNEKLLHDDFDPEQAGRFLQQDHFVMDTGQDLFIPEEEITLSNGEKRWVQVSKHPLVGPTDQIEQVLVVLVDITERKKMEASMVDAEKLAGLGTLAAGIAHEINSPLQIITGKTESLQRRLGRDRIDTDTLNSDLGAINRNAWRVAQIVRSLLDYAHPVSGETYPADVNVLIKDTLLLIEHQLKTWSNISVQTKLAENLPPLYCTSDEISRMLINLLTNARDAMPDGGQITISTRHDPRTRNIVLEVADTGPGISEDILSNIFDPFFTTKSVGKGTGLGLFIVHGIVHSRGGQIDVTSQAGEGTTFTISLPQDLRPVQQDSPGRYQT